MYFVGRRVKGLGCRSWGLRFVLGFRFKVWVLGLGVEELGWGVGFRMSGLRPGFLLREYIFMILGTTRTTSATPMHTVQDLLYA